MKCLAKEKNSGHMLLLVSVLCLILFAAVFLVVSLTHQGNNAFANDEGYLTLSEGWTLTDSSGSQTPISLPYILSYGEDGAYTLSRPLPAEGSTPGSPTLEFYSNYVDFEILLDDTSLLRYPQAAQPLLQGTGNTWHYLRLQDCGGKLLTVRLQCQLGSGITYLLEAPLLGSKSAMLSQTVNSNLAAIILSSVMLLIAFGLTVLYIVLRKQLRLDYSPIHLAVFSLLFSVYVFLETGYAKRSALSSYTLYVYTLMLLALLPVPLINLFAAALKEKYRSFAQIIAGINFANLFAQALLHFTRISNFRVMLPATHICIILSIAVMALLLLLSGKERGHWRERSSLLSAIPMVLGGCIDISLLWGNHPSFNNNLWFVVGVSVFILIQFVGAVELCFRTFKKAVESEYLRDIAYRDALSGLGNRNAYEQRLEQLRQEPPGSCGCIIADINRLKYINDTLGHTKGDEAIALVGHTITETFQGKGSAYRTGGDEFVILLSNENNKSIFSLASTLESRLQRQGCEHELPLTISVGWGIYAPESESLSDFLSRVDTMMYQNKRKTKCSH